MADSVEDNLVRKIPNPTVAQILDAFVFKEDEVERKWQLYMRGDLHSIEQYCEPKLEIIDVSDLELTISGEFDDYDFLHVGRRSDMWSLNFAAYHDRRRCFAFKGEIRLLKLFFRFIGHLFDTRRVDMAIIKPNCLMFPLDGINQGFTRQQFEDKIKIAECVLFIRDGATNVSPDSISAAAVAAAGSLPAVARGGSAVADAPVVGANGAGGPLSGNPSHGRRNRSNDPEEQEDVHWRYHFRQRNRPPSTIGNGADGANGTNGSNGTGSSSTGSGASNGRRRGG